MKFRILLNTLLIFSLFVLQLTVSNAQISGTKTIGSGGSYASLTAAISALTTNGVNGPVILELQSNYSSSSETFPITFGAIAGTSATNTITVRPATGATGLSITTSSALTIDLSGATYVIIDGRPGGSGTRNLVINNSSASGMTVRFINDACFNTIRHTVISGQNTSPTSGVVYFAGTSGSRGNDSNTVDNCDIKDDGGNTPCTSIYGSGSTAGVTYYNSNNFITNNNLINFWQNAASEVNAFKVSAGNTDWVITGNSMYQTSTRVPTSAFQLYFFNMNNTGANNHIMDNNWCGGSAPQCGGSPFTVNTTIGFRITGCYLNVGSTVPSSFSGNTFANFDITSGTTSYTGIPGVFGGPWLVGGLLNVNNNTFGSMNGLSSIKITSSVAGNAVYPIGATGTTAGTINLKGNKFGGIEVIGSSPTINTSLQCISIASSGTSVIYNIDSNVIGNPIADNLICSTPTTSSGIQLVMGIYNASATCFINARGNTIRNLRNNAIGSGSGISYFTHGIDIGAGGSDTISGNTIYNLNCGALYQNNNTGSAAIIGIRLTPSTGNNVISQNTIYGLNCTNNSAAVVGAIGIITNSWSSGRVDRNFVHSFSAQATGTGASLVGIQYGGGSARVFNNLVRLGIDTSGNSIGLTPSIIGLQKISGNLTAISNSIYIGGSSVGSGVSNTFAFSSSAAGSDSLYNNIFNNDRSNSSSGGTHVAIGLAGTTGLLSDYNLLYTTGNGGTTGMIGTTPYSGISAFNAVSGTDANSVNATPGFKLATGTSKTVDLHISASVNKGSSNVFVPGDFDGDNRSTPPDLGADEIPYDAGVIAIDSPTTTPFCGATKSIWVKIKNFGILPITSVGINININGVLFNSYNWTGNLTGGATSGSILIGSYNFTGGAVKLSVNTVLPNGKSDNNLSNDSTTSTITVIPANNTSANISTTFTTVCLNSSVTFKSTFVNGGTTPSFMWYKNRTATGITDTVYTTSTLADKDTIYLQMTSNAVCATPAIAKSNSIIMTVGSSLVPKVTVTNTSTTICPGGTVTFTASPSNGGTKPSYQWMRNTSTVGTDTTVFSISNANNGDSIRCIMTSNLSCASKSKDTSAGVKITVLPAPIPTATVTATSTSICAGTIDTFNVVITNGGTNPIYSWRKNNNLPIGTNSNQLITSSLVNGDSIYLQLSSNAACANPATVISNKVAITVIPVVTPTLTVTTNKTSICAGDSVTFKGTYTFGGNSPDRKWYKNSILFQTGIDSFTTSALSNRDTIYEVLISNAACATKSTITSSQIIISSNPVVTPSVSATVGKSSICSGTSVTFTATAVNGGTSPHYLWKKNGIVIGNDSSGFTTNLINNNDSVWVVLTSNALCATRNIDSSSKIKMSVTPSVTPLVSISTASNTFCSGTSVTFSSAPVNGGTAPHYTWFKNGVSTGKDSVGLVLLNPSDKDTIQVMLNSNATCVTTNDVKSNKIVLFMINSVTPSATISESSNNICKGTSVTFNSSLVNAGTNPTFNWKVNGISKSTGGSSFVTDSLNNQDTITLVLTSNATCALPATVESNKIGMKVNPLVTPHVSVSATPSVICSGGVVTFTAIDQNGGTKPAHRWIKNGNGIGVDSLNATMTVFSTDIIKCVLTSNASCLSKVRDTAIASLIVNPIPPKPSISRSHDTLFSSVANSYQWILGSNDISGSTQRFHAMTQNGNYRVRVDSAGCTNTSDAYIVSNVGINDIQLKKGNIQLWPNPGDGIVTINARFYKSAYNEITIMDLTGRILKNFYPENGSEYEMSLNLKEFKAGTYFISVVHDNETQIFKYELIH